jgi:hypothetical protein
MSALRTRFGKYMRAYLAPAAGTIINATPPRARE